MRIALLTLAGLFLAGPAWGLTIDQLPNATQDEFRLISEDLGAGLSYKPQTPTTPLGLTGFDIGAAVSVTKLQNVSALEKISSNKVSSNLPVPTLRAYKGLPFGIDFGLLYAKVPGSNIKLTGGELRYAIIEGGVAVPAVGIRGAFTKLSGVDQLALSTRSLDVSISKGFATLTPYAGLGRVWVDSNPQGVPVLTEEKFSEGKAFIGLGVNFLVMNLNFEADRTGSTSAYSFKLGFRF